MKPTDIITLQVYDGVGWDDVTDGLIDVSIVRGAQEYRGPFTQPDVGELSIKSRNENLDPSTNAIIKYGTQIRVNANTTRIFTGKIEGIDVEYRPLNEKNIITIKAVDIIGTLNKHILSEAFIAQQTNWTMNELYTELGTDGEIPDWQGDTYSSVGTPIADAPIVTGTNALDALQIRAKTNLGYMFANTSNRIEYWRHTKTDPLNPYNLPEKITFAYDGTGESYRGVFVSDGFDKIVNELTIRGNGINGTTTQISSGITAAIDVWGKVPANVNLASSNNTDLQTLSNTVLSEMAEPKLDIYKVTWDSTLNPDIAKEIDIMDNIKIKHRVSPSILIDRKYQVIGIQHTINYTDWETTYILRNWNYSSTVSPNPIITVNPPSGNTGNTFTFSYTYPNPAEITSVSWDLDDGYTSTLSSPTQTYVNSGTKIITLTLGTIYGYEKIVTVSLEVASGPPIAQYTYTSNAYNVYQFTYTGTPSNSYLWDFGDGTTSTDVNPTKYWTSTGTKIVKVTATNSFGSDIEQKTLAITGISNVPVRYIRYRYINAGHVSPTVYTTAQAQWFDRSIVNSISEGNIQAVACIEYDEHSGWITSVMGLDTYNRSARRFANPIIEQTYASNNLQKMYFGKYKSSGDPLHPSLYYIVDLGKEYFDIDNINFRKGTHVTYNGFIRIDVSQDGQTWYYARQLRLNDSVGSTPVFDNITSQPLPAKITLPIADPLPNYTPIRYVKIQTNNMTDSFGRWWAFNEVIPVSGDGVVAQGTGQPVDSLTGLGGIDTGKLTGASVEYAQASVGSIGSIQFNGTSDVNPITYYLAPTYNLPNMNNKTISTRIGWGATSGSKTFIYDFGVPLKKITGLYIDKRRGTKWDQYEAQFVGDNRFTFIVSVSADKTNWTNLGTFALANRANNNSQGAPNPTSTTRAVLIRVAPTVYNLENYYLPISPSSTFELIDVGPDEISGMPVLA